MIKALIFDFDGLILDTETPDFVAWQETYRAHGQTLPLERWAVCIGTAEVKLDLYAELESALGRAIDREAVRRDRYRHYRALLDVEAARPGVEAYLAGASESGLKLAIASSSPRDWVVGHLSRLGMADRFDCIKTREDVARTKPDPALYQAALDAFGIRAGEAIAFEDSPNGILAARRAGLFCVAVPNALTRRLPLDGADLLLDSLAEMPLETLLRRVEKRKNGTDCLN